MGYSIVGLIILILDIVAIIGVLGSAMEGTKKLLWILAILFLPVIGMVLWFVIGKKS